MIILRSFLGKNERARSSDTFRTGDTVHAGVMFGEHDFGWEGEKWKMMQQRFERGTHLSIHNMDDGILVMARSKRASVPSSGPGAFELHVRCIGEPLEVGAVTVRRGDIQSFEPWWAKSLLHRCIEPEMLQGIQRHTNGDMDECGATHLLSHALEAVLDWKEMHDNDQDEMLSEWRDMAVEW